MTLYRQLLIFSLLLFFLLFSGAWVAKLNSTRVFLLDQLQSHAQDTATSLGLTASPHMEKNDLPAIETIFNAVFDRGYYLLIRMTDMQGNVLVSRSQEVTTEGVPSWFCSLVRLQTPSATAKVMAGWRQAGEVMVESHPGYAYRAMWESAVRMFSWFVIMGVVVLVAGGIGLRLLLVPLKRVERQAEMICRRRYEVQEKLPRTRELRQVVEAMNRMTYRVKEMFDEQARIADRFRRNAYVDPLTGLGNRRYLEAQVSTRLSRDESEIKGAFLLVQIHELQELNSSKGLKAGDALLQRAGSHLAALGGRTPQAVLARFTGGNFAVFLPDADEQAAERFAADVVRELAQLAQEGLALSNNVGHVGGTVYDRATTLTQLLGCADTSLRAAQQQGPNKWRVERMAEFAATGVMGEQQWRDLLASTLKEKNVRLFGQRTVACTDNSQVVHVEIVSRVPGPQDKLIAAGQFLPLAERLDLVAALDRVVLEKVMQIDTSRLACDRLAVNISPTSLKDEGFRLWLQAALRNLSATAPGLFFEFPEFGAVEHLELVREFGARLHDLGHGYGLDHFGQGLSNFGYLKSLQPDYVKIDRAYTDELRSRESDSYFFIGSLAGVAHSLGITVIAEGVETQAQHELLCELNLDAIQGYYVGHPEPVQG